MYYKLNRLKFAASITLENERVRLEEEKEKR